MKRHGMAPPRWAAGALAWVAMLTACGPPGDHDRQFRAVVQRALDAQPPPICAELAGADLPIRIAHEIHSGPFTQRQLQAHDALTRAGLLTRTDTASPAVALYDLTDLGRRYLRAGGPGPDDHAALCAGAMRVVKITHVTARGPDEANGAAPVVQVDYQRRVDDIPPWAQRGDVRAAFPVLALQLRSDRAQITLARVAGQWTPVTRAPP